MRRTTDGRDYVAKGDYLTNKPRSHWLPTVLAELTANDIYAYFGCHAQRLAVCADMPWIVASNCWVQTFQSVNGEFRPAKPARGACSNRCKSHYVTECNGTHELSPTDECGSPVGPHLLSLCIDGFHPFDELLINQLSIANIQSDEAPPHSATVSVSVDGVLHTLPVTGVGNIIAVALLVNDTDCLGNTGSNVGFTVIRDPDTNKPVEARAIKIDPGLAFTDYTWMGNDTEPEAAFRARQAASTAAIGQFKISLGTRIATWFYCLPARVQAEFRRTLRSVLAASPTELRSLFTRPGLEAGDSVDTTARLNFLLARQAVLHSAYADLLLLRGDVDYAAAADQRTQHTPLSESDCVAGLKAQYLKSAWIRDPVTLEYHDVEQRFVNLCLVSGMRSSHAAALPIADSLVSSFASAQSCKAQIELKDVLSLCHADTRRVNLIGSAGMGKSTCCQCMVASWARGTMFSEFDLVLWVPLRNLTASRYPNGSTYTVVDIVIRECLGLSPTPQLRAVVAQVLQSGCALWILDGYDEIVDRAPDHLAAVLDVMLTSSNRILTGRQHAMIATEYSPQLVCDAEFEVAGFTDSNVREFVERFVHASGDVRLSAFDIVGKLRQSRVVWELAHVPVNLVLLCHVMMAELQAAVAVSPAAAAIPSSMEISLNLAELYAKVETLLLSRYLARRGTVLGHGSLPESRVCEPLRSVLCDVAWAALREGVVVIPASIVLHAIAQHNGTTPGTVTIDDLLLSGLLVQATDAVGGSAWMGAQFHFLHFTLQEYFAAKRVAGALTQTCSFACGDDSLSWLQAHKGEPQLEVMWWFVGGMLGHSLTAASVFTPLPKFTWKQDAKCCIASCGREFGWLGGTRYNCAKCGGAVCDDHSRHTVEHP